MRLIDYQFVDNLKAFELEEVGKQAMYSYQVFEDGIFVSATRPEIEVSLPLAPCEVRGLAHSGGPLFHFKLPIIPARLINKVLKEAKMYGAEGVESLFHLCWSRLDIYHEGWRVLVPPQERTVASCRPLDQGSHQLAIVEIHSHHRMAAQFSRVDDADETGFRIYGVIGRLDKEPEIRIRVGVYGYFWEIPASWVMQVPDGLRDCVEEE